MLEKMLQSSLLALIRRFASGVMPMLVLFLLLLLSLYILGDTAQNPRTFGRFYIWLSALNGIGVLFILVLIAINALQLVSQFRQRASGSRLTVKLVSMLVVVALVPTSIVYSFSINFLRSGIDSWFNIEIEQALDKAIQLSRDSIGLQMDALQQSTHGVAEQLIDASADEAVLVFSNIGDDASIEWTLVSSGGEIIASRGGGFGDVMSHLPGEELAAATRETGQYLSVDSIDGRGFFARVLVPVLVSDPKVANRLLQGLFPLSEDLGTLAESVEDTYQDYRQLVLLREPLKFSYTLTLSLVLMLSALMAVWFAFYSARRLMQPIRHLVEGTRAVAKGDYSTRLPNPSRDELGFLVRSFNDMTRRIAQARDTAETSQVLAESQRAYLETVLAHISTGVLTIDHRRVIRTANTAAAAILETAANALEGNRLAVTSSECELLNQFATNLSSHLDGGDREWSAEFELFSTQGRKMIVCRGAHIGEHEGIDSGYVLVFDDVTAMISAQREAAWSEVARRLAHEIKNPLTPIQLSAERMRHKLLNRVEQYMDRSDVEVLDRSTHTIVQQVESMKSMVKAFADYANTPTADFQTLSINELVREIAELYYGLDATLTLDLDLDPALPTVTADRSRLRQLLHNLVKNAIEAQSGECDATVLIQTRSPGAWREHAIELTVQDNGPGVPPTMLDRLFEPYVTSKPKGSGLGLAIVKKIAEEHGGSVSAANNPSGGARICVSLPLPVVQRQIHDTPSEATQLSIELISASALGR